MNSSELDSSKKALPYSILAEKIILGSILINSTSISVVSQYLPVEAFYIISHQIIYKTALSLYGKDKIIDYVTLVTCLQDEGLVNCIEDLSIIADFVNQVISISYLEDYISLVYEKYLRRLLIELGYEIIDLGFLTSTPLNNSLLVIEQKLSIIAQKKQRSNFITLSQGLNEILVEIKYKLKLKKYPGLTSGFEQLDSLIQGFQKSDMIILAGRPSMGKTAFALSLAKNMAKKFNIDIVFFSLEMSKEQLIYRLLANEVGINNLRLRSGRLSKNEWVKINLIIKELSKLSIYIEDTPNTLVYELSLKVKQLQQEYTKNLGLIIIDYLQLLETGQRNETRAQELSQITRILKKLARDLNIPILALSQLSRGVESRINKRPLLSDLRESGCFSLVLQNHLQRKKNFWVKKKNIMVLGWNGKEIIPTLINKIKHTGYKPIYHLQTNLTWKLKISSNHKILTNIGWKRIDQLTRKDKIFLKLSLPENFYTLISFTWVNVNMLLYSKLNCLYDLKVYSLANYIVNKILIHNSIEQDADVVMMLYRDEYYYPQTLEKNIIEIIIAKHRNGPVGVAKLRFDTKHLRFYNL